MVGRVDPGQRPPGGVEEFLTPAGEERAVAVLALRARRRQFGNVAGQGPRPRLLGAVVVGDQVNQGRLDVVAEAAALGGRTPKVPTEETERELLAQIGSRVRVADR